MAARWRAFALTALFLFSGIGAALLLWHLQGRRLIISPPSRMVLIRVTFAALRDWKSSDASLALEAFRRSCAEIAGRQPSTSMGGAGYAGSAAPWQNICAGLRAAGTVKNARQFFEANFSPFEVQSTRRIEALFTGYYEPEIFASHVEHGAYRTPIYGPPRNLVNIDLALFREYFHGEYLEGCLEGHSVLPCPTRAEIDSYGLRNAPVLVYANDPIAVFFMHIQGSGRVRLEDGSMVRLSYAGQNGRKYTPIGRVLVERGLLGRSALSMQAIRDWMRAHLQTARKIMEADESYVFFQARPIGDPSLGSSGTEGVPLTPGGSLAVDPRFHPFGVPVYIAASRPDADPAEPDQPFNRLLVAQDTGGAIRGPLRGDVFWGFGQEAESIAGRMKSKGRMFVLLPKEIAKKMRAAAPAAGQ